MSEKLIPNRFLNLYRIYNKDHRKEFTIKDVVHAFEEDLEPTDKLFIVDEYFAGIRENVLKELKNYLNNWYEKDKVFERQYREIIEKSEKEIPNYLKQLNEIRKNSIEDRRKKGKYDGKVKYYQSRKTWGQMPWSSFDE